LRGKTEEIARKTHELIEAGVTPKPVYEKKCESCSLFELCLPKTVERRKSVDRYLRDVVRDT
jgi:CRISPR-associated exonuclease Cas4